MPLTAVVCACAVWLRLALPSFDALPDVIQFSRLVPPAFGTTSQVVFEPSLPDGRKADPRVRWVAAHVDTPLWSGPDAAAQELETAYQWSPLQIEGRARGHRLPVLDPSRRLRAWVDATNVGPIDPSLLGSAHLPPIGRRLAWAGAARVTMYTCVELGGCNATASGLWPHPGIVAVDPQVIPLGSTVWIQGVGTFLAADTGSLVRGAHLDIYSLSYEEALSWGVQQRSILVFSPD